MALSGACVLLAFGASTASAAPSMKKALGFRAGPLLTPAGPMWLGTRGLELVRESGALFNGPTMSKLPTTAHGSHWEVVMEDGRLRAGRLEGHLRPLAPFGRCAPLQAAVVSPGARRLSRLLAVSGVSLYAAIDPRCLHRQHYGAAALIAVNLERGSWRLLRPISPGTVSIAAAGRYLLSIGLPASSSEEKKLTGAVYDLRTGKRLSRIEVPGDQGRAMSIDGSVDADGDVLVTVTSHRPPPVPLGSAGWWFAAGSHVAHVLPRLLMTSAALERGANYPYPAGIAALSDGRVAYAKGAMFSGEKIELVDIARRKTRLVAKLQSATGVLGLDLDRDRLAWAQENAVPVGSRKMTPSGGWESSCSTEARGPAKLAIVDLRTLPAHGLALGKGLPAEDQPPCTWFER